VTPARCDGESQAVDRPGARHTGGRGGHRSTTMTRLVNVYRGDLVESFHSGSVVVVDSTGRILASAGDPAFRTFLRSAAKPFQALPLLTEGGAEEFDLSGEEIALICGSHGGEPRHVSTAAAILRKGEFDESDLICGTHEPFDQKAAAELRQSGESPSVLQNNCSGKHAGMLLATTTLDVPSSGYGEPAHPLQMRIRQTLAEFSGLPPDEVLMAMDGCGVPSFYLSLYRTALAYARLSATAHSPSSAGALPRYAESASDVFESMTMFPDYVAGTWSITTPLMDGFHGELLAKEGAEGFYAMGASPELSSRLTERLRLPDDCTIGIAIKIADGSMNRGRDPVVLRTLELLGADPEELSPLSRFRQQPLRNTRGVQVGEARAEFELEFL
jgi:L-asparaginase II